MIRGYISALFIVLVLALVVVVTGAGYETLLLTLVLYGLSLVVYRDLKDDSSELKSIGTAILCENRTIRRELCGCAVEDIISAGTKVKIIVLPFDDDDLMLVSDGEILFWVKSSSVALDIKFWERINKSEQKAGKKARKKKDTAGHLLQNNPKN